MRILFIYSNHATYLGPHYNHGIGFLAAVLKDAGHEVGLLTYDRPIAREKLVADVKRHSPDMVGFSVASNQYKYGKLYSGWIGEDLGVPMVVGGVHAMLEPERVMNHEAWDYLIVGEAEDAMVELADALDRDLDPGDIRNLWLRRGDDIIRNEIRPLREDLDALPFPDRDVFDEEHLLEGDRRLMSYLAGRGCPYNCSYCSNPAFRNLYKGKGKWVRLRSPSNVLDEIRLTVKRYDPKILAFNDDIFTLKRDWVYEFLDGYNRDVRLPFNSNVRVETVDREMLEALKKAGCVMLRVGVEHGDETFRREVLRRNMSNEQIENVFRWAHELDLPAWSFNIIGFPGETPELIRSSIELNRRLNPHHMQISIFNPYPGTELMEKCMREGYLPAEFEHRDGYFDPETTLDLKTMTPEELKALHREFVDLCAGIRNSHTLEEKYRGRKIHINLLDMLGEAKIAQPVDGYVKETFFTLDEDSRRTLQEHPVSTVTFELRIPPRSAFEAAVALHPGVWDIAEGDGVSFEVYVTPRKLIGRGKRELLISRHLDPRRNRKDRCWIDVEADLSSYSNRDVKLELATRMRNDSTSDYNTAGWANPVIVEAR